MIRKRNFPTAAAIALLVVIAAACGEDEPTRPPTPNLTTPEGVLEALVFSYEQREIEAYATLLAPEFRFHFHEWDLPSGLEGEYWNRDEDSTGTGGLLATTAVKSISLDLALQPSGPAGEGWPAGARHVRATVTGLTVEQTNQTSLMVKGDIQDFYLRKGLAEAAEDTSRWYLLEWFDRGGSLDLDLAAPSHGIAPDGRADGAPRAPRVIPTTWGHIKMLFS